MARGSCSGFLRISKHHLSFLSFVQTKLVSKLFPFFFSPAVHHVCFLMTFAYFGFGRICYMNAFPKQRKGIEERASASSFVVVALFSIVRKETPSGFLYRRCEREGIPSYFHVPFEQVL